ncbi:MAG: formate--tetrahydrofolate ligase [Thermodesulfobacteriota bacterium]
MKNLLPIEEVASTLGLPERRLVPFGRFMAKVDPAVLDDRAGGVDGRLIVVTSMSPTPAGEGKTTLTIGLAQSMKLLGLKAAGCIRQPSLGPLFGTKGGATGSGLSMVHPAEEIAMHFTGDDAAVASAHNLIASAVDNHVYHGNPLAIDRPGISWPRVSVVNDRMLRRVRLGVGIGDHERRGRFIISAASELMSVLCVSRGTADLRERAGRVVVGRTLEGAPVTAEDIKAAGAAAALMKNAVLPNLVQSTEGAAVFVHGGPFGNISLGCSTLLATRLALRLADYVLVEAGFATDLGAEKFFDILCRGGAGGGLRPAAAVVVATLAALRLHGGAADYTTPDRTAAVRGLDNLAKHVENIRLFGVPAVVALNRYASDRPEELREIKERIEEAGIPVHVVDVREGGPAGGLEAAERLTELCAEGSAFRPLYPLDAPIKEKIASVAAKVYGAAGVAYTDQAEEDLRWLEQRGFGGLAVCMAKTHRSLSDDPDLLGRPTGFEITVRRVELSAGAGFVVPVCGKVLLLPGLPARPRLEGIDVDSGGNITGL